MVEGMQTQITTSRAEPVVQLVMRALLALGYDTRVGEVEEILTSVKDSLTEGGPLAEALSYIWCDDYLCPGGHYSRRLDYDEEKLAEGHRCYSSGERTWVEGHLPEGVYYVGEGECAALVTVTLDSEGDPGASSTTTQWPPAPAWRPSVGTPTGSTSRRSCRSGRSGPDSGPSSRALLPGRGSRPTAQRGPSRQT
jgi:hypothetical protein